MTLDTEPTIGRVTDDPIELARALAEDFRPAVVKQERLGEPLTRELARVREAGLVNLHIPTEFGGGGGNWQQISRVVLELSRVAPNIGGLLAHHYHNFIPPFLDPFGDAAEIQRKSAVIRWLWGHLSGPLDGFKAVHQPDGTFVVSGYKHQNTGAATGDVTTLIALRTDRGEALYAYVPTDREGIAFHGGWDHLGLRRTATQPVSFDNVVVLADEVLPNSTGRPLHTLPPFYHAGGSLMFGAIYVGAALGALERGREYLLTDQGSRGGPKGRTIRSLRRCWASSSARPTHSLHSRMRPRGGRTGRSLVAGRCHTMNMTRPGCTQKHSEQRRLVPGSKSATGCSTLPAPAPAPDAGALGLTATGVTYGSIPCIRRRTPRVTSWSATTWSTARSSR